MKSEDILPRKMIACHLEGDASITAAIDGQSLDNSMSYSLLEGVRVATGSGDTDLFGALTIKEHLDFSLDSDKNNELVKNIKPTTSANLASKEYAPIYTVKTN